MFKEALVLPALKKIEVGKKFAHLRVLDIYRDLSQKRRVIYKLKCDCGKIFDSRRDAIVFNKNPNKSCGCIAQENRKNQVVLNKTHGLSNHKIYRIWSSMKGRCLNKKDSHYQDYGGRGITICEEWHSFKNFYRDMGSTYKVKESVISNRNTISLDRIDNSKGYSKENCVWRNQQEQMRNLRKSIYVNGISIVEFCKKNGIVLSTAYSRVKQNKPICDILPIPVITRGK